MAEFSKIYSIGPTRVQYVNKDPRGWKMRDPRSMTSDILWTPDK